MDDPGGAFTAMAARLDRIDPAEFAGAAVIVPKDGEPIVVLLADPAPKPAQFWSLVASRVEIAVAEARQAEEAAASPYGGRLR